MRLFSLTALLLALGCGPSTSTTVAPVTTDPTADTKPDGPAATTVTPVMATLESVGLSTSAMNRGADPCTDFYEFTCGGWHKTAKIPGDRSSWSRGFHEIITRNEADLKAILETAGGNSANPMDAALGSYYRACMDEAAVEKAGLSGIAPLLAKARKLRNRKQISEMITELHRHGIAAVFGVQVDQDFKDPELVIAHLGQGGLGLPDRDYYLKDDARSKGLRAAYLEHVEKTFVLSGMKAKRAKKAAAQVMKLETALAKASKTRVEMRDVKNSYNKVDASGLAKLVRNFHWKTYYKGMGRPDLKDISISGKVFFKGFNTQLKKQSAAVWSSYLQWKILDASSATLPKAFVDQSFAMKQAFTGQKQQKPRWKRCVAATDAAMPDYLGQAFVAKRFPGKAKQSMITMVKAISQAFAVNVAGYDWMDSATKKSALEKRAKMAYLIGYPDKWKSHKFAVDAANYAKNALAARAEKMSRDMGKVGKPLDRNEWLMSASTVNAYYHPLRNHMVFPAGILQPPFFDPKASTAVNLGALGMVVGHELTHGFDDQGAQFAANGALKNWWSPEVGAKFKSKTQCVVDQYSKYEVLPGAKLNGKLTLGENIADMGGVKLAFDAYRELTGGGAANAGGFTADQQFFLSVGQAWCSMRTEERTRVLLQVDPHSPAKFRVNGGLANVPAFAKAFQCKQGTPMNRANVCTVW